MEAEKQGLAHPEVFGQAARAANGTAAAAPAASKSKQLVTADAVVKEGKGKGKADDEPPGQVVDLVFMGPRSATYNLSLVAMSDCWVGADETVQVGSCREGALHARVLCLGICALCIVTIQWLCVLDWGVMYVKEQ